MITGTYGSAHQPGFHGSTVSNSITWPSLILPTTDIPPYRTRTVTAGSGSDAMTDRSGSPMGTTSNLSPSRIPVLLLKYWRDLMVIYMWSRREKLFLRSIRPTRKSLCSCQLQMIRLCFRLHLQSRGSYCWELRRIFSCARLTEIQ